MFQVQLDNVLVAAARFKFTWLVLHAQAKEIHEHSLMTYTLAICPLRSPQRARILCIIRFGSAHCHSVLIICRLAVALSMYDLYHNRYAIASVSIEGIIRD